MARAPIKTRFQNETKEPLSFAMGLLFNAALNLQLQAFPEAMLDYFLILTLIQGYILANKWSLDAENKIDFVIQPKSSQAI